MVEFSRPNSSVGLEQRPSKAWVVGSNPTWVTKKNRIMNLKEELITHLKSMGKHQIIYGLSHNGSTQKALIQGVIESFPWKS